MEDSQIIGFLFQRSEQAIRAIQEKYGGLCRSVVSNILPDFRDVDECISDTYLRVWRSIPPQHPDRLDSYIAGSHGMRHWIGMTITAPVFAIRR